MSDLEDGIQTYQSMAEQKEREVEEEKAKLSALQQENNQMKLQIERLNRKLKDNKLEIKAEKMIVEDEINSPLSKKEETIRPIKLLFLKYFEPSSNYETKVKTFNTLCEALSLNHNELEIMNQYKRSKLQWQLNNDKKEKSEKKF